MLVTFKDLKKRVSLEVTQQQSRLFQRLHNKPFWIWDIQEHKQEGVEKAMFDYEKILYDSIFSVNDVLNHSFKHKHLWVKKATGLGVTEFFLRLMAYNS
jgi:hypothetical protein